MEKVRVAVEAIWKAFRGNIVWERFVDVEGVGSWVLVGVGVLAMSTGESYVNDQRSYGRGGDSTAVNITNIFVWQYSIS